MRFQWFPSRRRFAGSVGNRLSAFRTAVRPERPHVASRSAAPWSQHRHDRDHGRM